MELKELVIGSTNKGKIKDLLALIPYKNIKVTLASDLNYPDPEEIGNTFEENALIKAMYYGKLTELPSLGDDSGIIFNQLSSFPGINTKRFADECGGYKEAFDSLNEMLKSHASPHPAEFITSLVLYMPDKNITITGSGSLKGEFCYPPRGTGFGYLPVFIPEGYNKTLAELEEEEKNKISHRSSAVKDLFSKLKEIN
ncbi:MAG: non-canonical purine NTP pyrophosphatase [Sphingobacteriia bacterium]|nr:non-canonical purine NTP pyrophosphatase [Sphingobacteriia bacterium]